MKVCKQGSHQIIHIKARRCQYRKNMPYQKKLSRKPKTKNKKGNLLKKKNLFPRPRLRSFSI